MKIIEGIDKNGTIPAFHLEDEIANLSIDFTKPSSRVLQTKIGLKTIALLKKIYKENDHSWYKEILIRAQNNMEHPALFYRANKISYRQMFEHADAIAKSMAKAGLKKGDTVACCLANTPELVYIMLAANKMGVRLNLFGTNLDKEYMKQIMDGTSKKLMFCTDNNYEIIKDTVNEVGFDKKIVVSLADSLPEHPELCDEYEPDLAEYYKYPNLVPELKRNDSSIESINEFVAFGHDYDKEIIDDNTLDTPFTTTYSSGSTRIGFPKPILHCNRSYIVGGIYNDTNLTGSPSVPEIRGLAHIHSDSNTNLVTAISDNLIKRGTVALEPEYDKHKMLDCIVLNKPVHLDATTSFLVQAAKDYLVSKKFHQDGIGKKLPYMLVTMAVGEPTTRGEEKFINRFLREAKAGSGIKLNGIHLPYAPLSIGGGDCEHGGIYYTLLKELQALANTLKIGKQDYGMVPVPFSVVTALKKMPDGTYEECNYGEYGIIVANSITSMAGYDHDIEKTKSKVIVDKYGREWLSCDTYGYINKLGNAVIKGRKEDTLKMPNNTEIPAFLIEEVIGKDTKNILSCSVTKYATENGDIPIANIEFSPFMKKSKATVVKSIIARSNKLFPKYISERMMIRVISNEDSYPLTGSGKRSIPALQNMGLENVYRIVDNTLVKVDLNERDFVDNLNGKQKN